MSSRSTPQSKASQDSPARPIPSCYEDENEHWTLLESGWVNYAWDLSLEEESAFARGELPPGAFIPSQVSAALESQAKKDADAQAALLRNIEQIFSEAAPLFDFDEPLPQTTYAPLNVLQGTYTTAPPVTPRHNTTVVSKEHIEDFFTPQTRPGPSNTPSTPQRTRLYLSTPELSPSSSVCSDPDTDWELEVETPQKPAATNLKANLIDKPSHGLDLDFFAKPAPMGCPLPLLFRSSGTPFVAPSAGPSTGPAWAAHHAQPKSPSAYFNRGSSGGPSRTPGMRMQRKMNAVPYARKAKRAQVKDDPAVETAATASSLDLVCSDCGYVQARGAGDVRSFKRHLQTHPQFKSVEWRCRGIQQPDGTYYGGCGRLFARKDALQRHVKTSKNTACMSDFQPIEVSVHGSEYDYDPVFAPMGP
ncbi:hypothetical protein M0805_009052 [Coniferiporia weirii]|nr:hypothetical protein M0805_009052 [Coniferiporia weirii]